MEANGFEPYLVMQANHSGRYSNPDNKPAPLIAYRHPELEQFRAADDSCIVSDDYLRGLEEKYGEATKLAKEAGFDAVDIKSCHGYLFVELLSAYNRPGEYGGSYENRTRMLKNCVSAAKAYEDEKFAVTCRLGIYDGYAYPYGFGVSPEGGVEPDFTEPIQLVKELNRDFGMQMIDITMGNPYATTHVTRPYDNGKYIPDEHPFVGIDRMIKGIGAIKKAVPEMVVFGSAPTYLRQYSDLLCAGMVEQGLFGAGEVCGTHGVTRPGGSALNSGQVGAIRSAESIHFRKLQKIYLTAMLDYARMGVGSRGSALYTNAQGEKPLEVLPDSFRCILDAAKHNHLTQEVSCGTEGIGFDWREIRPLPERDDFFENQWRLYRERRKIK